MGFNWVFKGLVAPVTKRDSYTNLT